MRRLSLGSSLVGPDNALNFIRLVLAGLVIVGHSWPLGGFGPSRGERMADLAVNGFFAVSGYLICGSRLRSAFGTFMVRRLARILPGFWLCIVCVAVVFAPLSTCATGEPLEGRSALTYVLANAGLEIRQPGISATLEAVPFPHAWNGSLWTLWFEFVAYLSAGLILLSRHVRRHLTAVLWLCLLLLAAATWAINGPIDVSTNRYHYLVRLGGFFVAGMAIYTVRYRLRLSAPATVAALVAAGAMTFALEPAMAQALSPGLLAYGLVTAAALLPVRVAAVNDISYGTYLYAFPVQQLLAAMGAPRFGFVVFALLSIVITIPLAVASWLLVERPTLQLAHRVLHRSRGARLA